MKMTIGVCSMVLAGVAAMAPAKAHAATDADKAFVAMAAQSDQNEIALSTLAQQKATSADVKAFAAKMVTDHTKLTSEMKPFAASMMITPPAGPDADHQAELDKLNGLSGADFDKEYMAAMAADHAKALDAFTTEAKTTPDASLKATVVKGRTVVAAHKMMADRLEKKVM